MRHRIKKLKLSRDSSHRKCMLRNMTISLIRHGTIMTTLSKSRGLRMFTNPFIHNLLHIREEFNVIRYIKKKISGTCKTSIDTVFKYYLDNKEQIKSNYIKVEKYCIRRSDTAKIVKIILI